MKLCVGACVDRSSREILILFWGKMEALPYALASETKQYLMDEKAKQEQLAAEQQQALGADIQSQIEEAARQAAMRDAGMTDGADTANYSPDTMSQGLI